MFPPAHVEAYIEPNILVNSTRLKIINVFVHLGSTLVRDGSLNTEILPRIPKTSDVFGKREWADRDISRKNGLYLLRMCINGSVLFIGNMHCSPPAS